MNNAKWKVRITCAVGKAIRGNPTRLETLAQELADLDTAKEALISAGYGSEGDELLELVAVVIEGKGEIE